MQDSVFTKIIKGELPCHKVYEDERTFAFLTIGPIQPGHTLVVPKKQVDHLWDLDDEDYQAVMAATKKVARHMRDVLQPKRVGIELVGLDVPHAHIHIIPFNTLEEFRVHPEDLPAPSQDALAEMAKKLRLEDAV